MCTLEQKAQSGCKAVRRITRKQRNPRTLRHGTAGGLRVSWVGVRGDAGAELSFHIAAAVREAGMRAGDSEPLSPAARRELDLHFCDGWLPGASSPRHAVACLHDSKRARATAEDRL
jgi:hypothetical protein